MNTPKHTPGPWKYSTTFRQNDGSWSVTAEVEHVAFVTFHGTATRGHGYEAPDPEGQANAALIAQAPALLGLAQGYRAFLVRNGAEDDGLLRTVLETVDAILAKAAPSC